MKLRDAALLAGAAGAALLVYGALVEAERLVVERRRLPLRDWPERLAGLRVAVLADLHVRDEYSARLAARAVTAALAANPDVVLVPGDVVSHWAPGVLCLLAPILAPLAAMNGNAIFVPGNHEYSGGRPEPLIDLLAECGVRTLRNEALALGGVVWAGIDSANEYRAEPHAAMARARALAGGKPRSPIVAIWHEPDMADLLPPGAALMVSGHSHGGQFRLPGGYAPMHSVNGRKYVRGFFPSAPTPLYVSRGVGTTGPPSRLNCPPEVSILELVPAPAERLPVA